MPEHELDLLRDAALAAGRIAKRHFRNSPETREKPGGQGPVTEADLEIDRMLKGELLAARPDYGWLSEETEDDPERLTSDYVFIIDPIDGTRAFIAGEKTFAHSLALAHKGDIIAAVVHLPLREETFEAAIGAGAKLNGQTIGHSGQTQLNQANILAAAKQMKSDHWKNEAPPVSVHFRSSLAFRMCLVAQGRFDGMLTLRPSWEWDIAAGDLICREAGAVVTDRNDAKLIFNNAHPQTDGVLAASPGVHAGLMGYL